MAAMFVNGSGQNEQSLERTFHRCFLPSFTSFGWGVTEEKITMWKINGRQTTHAKWWQKLTLPLARWANNKLRWVILGFNWWKLKNLLWNYMSQLWFVTWYKKCSSGLLHDQTKSLNNFQISIYTLSCFQANQSLLCLINAVCLAEK